jgi:hypothetical protein
MLSYQKSLAELKDRIDDAPRWDFYKGFTNEYERIYSVPPCVYVSDTERKPPCSRAFFKLWEIVYDAWAELEPVLGSAEACRFAYVGEGPGSFIEAVVTLRRLNGRSQRQSDEHAGITLRSGGYTVPHWRLSRQWCARHGVRLCSGKDGSGDIYKPDNMDSFVREAGGPGSCDMVTGDGGFDFSSNFNSQEASMLRMLVSEVMCALALLREGGAFVLKTFDTFNASTRAILVAAQSVFRAAEVRKPKSSRPANAERYLVCVGFRRDAAAAALETALRGWVAENPVSGSGGGAASPSAVLEAEAEALRRALDAWRALDAAQMQGETREAVALRERRVCETCIQFAESQIAHLEATLHNAHSKAEEDREVALRVEQLQRQRAAEWRARYFDTPVHYVEKLG